MLDRRRFLGRTGLVFGGAVLGAAGGGAGGAAGRWHDADAGEAGGPDWDPMDWGSVRGQFALDPAVNQMSGFYLAPHPAPVRRAIERHRRGFDANPMGYHHAHITECEVRVHESAGRYLGVDGAGVALTDSTTMGLGLVYGAIRLEPGEEVLTTTHDHYSTWRSLELRAERTGAVVRSVELYKPGGGATVEGIVGALRRGITARTRLVAVTWVHSSTGVRLPIREIAAMISEVNRGRDEGSRILLSVDGVHGLGVVDAGLPELGCDIFIAGTHKWMFGPRGTGLVWANERARELIAPVIPPFSPVWFEEEGDDASTWGMELSPGGFHSFEHRWALSEAFAFHERIGKPRVSSRIHTLNRGLKDELAGMGHVTLHTPRSDALSAGMVCFEVAGMAPWEVVERLGERGILGSTTPYEVTYARLAPGLLNTEGEVEAAVRAVRELG